MESKNNTNDSIYKTETDSQTYTINMVNKGEVGRINGQKVYQKIKRKVTRICEEIKTFAHCC